MTYAEAYELKIMIQSRIIAMATGQGNNFIESPKFRNIHEQVPYRRNFPVLNEEYSQTEVISASEYSPKLTNN